MQVSGPDYDDPNIIRDDFLTPCSPGAPGAFEATWREIDPDKFLEPAVTMEDMLKSLESSKPSVNDEDMDKMNKFTEDFGIEG